MRIVGIDVGEKRIGVAAADDRMAVAVPVATVSVEGDPVEAIVRLVADQQADELVVGLPLSLSGAMGPQAERVQAAVEELSARLHIPVHTWDERLTSVQADRRPRTDRRRRGRGRREGRDAVAAAILLQAYLDRARSSP